jgi:AcrR family transcriptional regulator
MIDTLVDQLAGPLMADMFADGWARSLGHRLCPSSVTSLRYAPAVPRPKQRTPELRDHLLQVAVGMLERDGVAGFTTRKVAQGAGTSTPAVYELFGDRAGLVREIFFEGFRLLRRYLDQLEDSDDPRADLVALTRIYRRFATDNPTLAEVMFSRPFADFDPAPSDAEAGRIVREFIVGHVRRAIDAGVLAGDATDDAHVLLAVTQGLAGAESASRLGRSKASIDRRWARGIDAVLDGLATSIPVGGHAPASPRRTKAPTKVRGGRAS